MTLESRPREGRARSLAGASFATLCTLSPCLVAQHTSEVRIGNYTSFARREWSLAAVPFPRGAWRPGTNYRPEGLDGELIPFGATWPDGSVRQARLCVRTTFNPGQEKLVRIVPGTPTLSPFVVSPWTASALSQLRVHILVGDGGQMHAAPLVPVRLEHDSDARKLVYCSARIPGTDLIYDLWLTFYSDQDHAPFELRITNSRVGSTQWKQTFDWIFLAVDGAMPHVRGAVSRDVHYREVSARRGVVQLMGASHLFDGQAQAWTGDLLFPHTEIATTDATLRRDTLLATVQVPLYGCATNWKESKALGPFGHIPDHPSWIPDPRATAWAERAKFESWYLQPATPWSDIPRGLFPQASSSGDQYDFGVVKMQHVFHTGLPLCIEEALEAGMEDARRPYHHREANGDLVLARNRPNWVVWNGRTHFNRSVSSDRLGKPFPEPWPESHGWGNRDNQHWSSLTLASGYLLTGSPSLRMEIDTQIELFLAGHTLPSQKPGWSTNGIDSSRAIGRTLLSMAWFYLLTGREDVRTHMSERLRQCHAVQWLGGSVAGPVKPLTNSDPDPRILPDFPFWRPWEEAIAIVGLEAAYRVTGRPEARALAAISAKTTFTYGWRLTATGAEIASGVRWKDDGQALTAAEYADPRNVNWSVGTGFELWALPATKLAKMYGEVYLDSDLAARAQIAIDSIYANRQVPSNRRWDNFYEWESIDR